jgi:hypothetical protein
MYVLPKGNKKCVEVLKSISVLKYNMLMLYRKFSQGLSVAVCASMTIMTLGYMCNDAHKVEKRQLQANYENQITVLHDEINKLKLESSKIKYNQ